MLGTTIRDKDGVAATVSRLWLEVDDVDGSRPADGFRRARNLPL